MTHSAGPDLWDAEYERRRQADDDLDWGDQWTAPFTPILAQHGVRRLVDLGCGTGNDVLRLNRQGFRAVGLDFSWQAVAQASAKDASARFLMADMARTLPFADDSLEAIMANVAVHMFDDLATRRLFAELRRVVSPTGLLLLHVNALEDRPLRARHHPPDRELEQDFVLEKDGQTMHFFSDDYLRELLAGWSKLGLDLVTIPHRDTGEPFKVVWRVVAR